MCLLFAIHILIYRDGKCYSYFVTEKLVLNLPNCIPKAPLTATAWKRAPKQMWAPLVVLVKIIVAVQ